jgi:integrase
MNQEVVTQRSTGKSAVVYSDAAKKYAKKSKSENTKRAYRTAMTDFKNWCDRNGRVPLPAYDIRDDVLDVSTVVDYLSHCADQGQKKNYVDVKRAAIAYAHTVAGYLDPTKHPDVKTVMSGIAQDLAERGLAAPTRKDALTVDDLRAMVDNLDRSTIVGKRNAALLLFGFAGAFRRSELVGLDTGDLRLNGTVKVLLRTSKTDSAGEGQLKHIPHLDDKSLCPVCALTDYLDAAQINSGPVFRRLTRAGEVTSNRLSAQSVALVVKKSAKRAGLDPRNLSGHSLRAGFVTASKTADASDTDVMQQTGHTSSAMLARYVRDAGQGAERAVLKAFGENHHET